MQAILIISNYYPPEKGAAANRIGQLALKLKERQYRVTVVCPLANYPNGKIFPQYKNRIFVKETLDEIDVRRLWIYPSISKNVFKRLLSVLSFSAGLCVYLLFKKIPEKVVVQSPPLLLSFLSVSLLSIRKRKIILNVSDLWPMAALELSALKPGSFSHKISLRMERFIYSKATVVLGQSNEIITHVNKICPNKASFLYRNFPDHNVDLYSAKPAVSNTIKMFYAGLLGVAQGVLEVCENIRLHDLAIEFHIFGDGAESIAIRSFIEKFPEKNIVFHGMMDRTALLLKLQEFDVALVPLKTRIFGSVPSKIFEYTALGIPILYFGGGEGEDIVLENNLGWVADVGDFGSLNTVLASISCLGKVEIQSMKRNVFEQSGRQFNLDLQIDGLIAKGVF